MVSSTRTPEQQRTIDRFTAAVETEAERSNCSRREAIANVARRDPNLHRQYLQATNPPTIGADL